MLLAIETSCDETAVAVLDIAQPLSEFDRPEDALRADLISSQTKLHEAYGGVVPELAAREHIKSLPALVSEALRLAGIGYQDISAVAATRGPGLNGCLLVGLSFAKALAYARKVPLLAVNHLEAHLFSADLLPAKERPTLPMLALLVSGGHTLLVHVKNFREYQLVARTLDDAVGEAFDKTATLLGLDYPGGPQLAAAAEKGRSDAYLFPVGMKQEADSFSFSGVKTAVSRSVQAAGESLQNPQVVADFSASIQAALVRALVDKSMEAARKFRPKSFFLTGGVAANEYLRAQLAAELKRLGIPLSAPPRRWCTDNAAMVAALGSRLWHADKARFQRWSPDDVNQLLGPNIPGNISSLPRWSLLDCQSQ